MMRKYYKDRFDAYAKKYKFKTIVKTMPPSKMNEICSEYINLEFPSYFI